MTTMASSSPLVFEPIPITLLNAVRAQALGSDAQWEALEHALSATPAECLARLGATLALETLGMDALHRLTPDFSVLPYPEALRDERNERQSPADLHLLRPLRSRLADLGGNAFGRHA